nr:HTH domain-containing protein [Treponema pedis]
MNFGQKHLNDLFVLDGIVSVKARDIILRDIILREIISNTLAHRDYSSGLPAKMIIDEEKIIIENSNLAHGVGILDIQKFEPFPKNPSISKVFREIGLADELGSGMRNTYKYVQLYSEEKPIFEEGNIFRTIIPLKKIATQKVARNVAQAVARNTAHEKAELIAFIKEKIRKDKKITRQAIADAAGVSKKTIERYIKEIDNLKYVGRGSNGHWEIDDKGR